MASKNTVTTPRRNLGLFFSLFSTRGNSFLLLAISERKEIEEGAWWQMNRIFINQMILKVEMPCLFSLGSG